MNILHWMKKENSGLARSTLELATYEEKQGHNVVIRQPGEDAPIYGIENGTDIHLVHSQIAPRTYHDGKPKIMWCHGEPISSVGNGVSMKAICDMAPILDAMICMRREELPIWSSIKRTHLVPKGIDLDVYKPLPGITERLSGEPAVGYLENWRAGRNPLYLCEAMELVHRKIPKARLHLFNCPGGAMEKTFKALIQNNKWWPHSGQLPLSSLCAGHRGIRGGQGVHRTGLPGAGLSVYLRVGPAIDGGRYNQVLGELRRR
jgi:hypothetical protein